ncbi:homoserine acetyltransferase [Cryobacterium roopkundense]|uniref:Homoserine O-acetyltransferase n=1 Tax=Cryobacterium roopkundense TaxID=1001240 RepID=A0A099J1G7_9MICO|nr:homoserine O-acetyltransferase [Cryobacterium roopkundense]KGJ72264.1 homoserine acetyltransferase [Cryobacterium roopkundense]MBB5640080.1 homoserine O-acetyltransferase [Cryobacterium roopkundense]
MEWQSPSDTVPSSFITEAQARSLLGKPPASGAWRDGDPVGNRRFENIGALHVESGESLPFVRIAYETWGRLSATGDNAILVLHALTGDSHLRGPVGSGHKTAGWWSGIVGPGLALDTDRYFVVAPNMLGGCQGSTGPASLAPDGAEWGIRFPYVTIRDQVAAQIAFADRIGIDVWAAVVGGSMGGMHALEWAIRAPERVERLAILAAPPVTTADQIALNSVQIEAVRTDPAFHAGEYYDADDGDGPTRGLALARRMALLNYRSPAELNTRFDRDWQSPISPLGAGGRFAVESYLDFHGNKFTRRFDANSYITLVEAMNSHDVGRGRGGIAEALSTVTARSLIVGIDSDRLFPLQGQNVIAEHLPHNIDGPKPVVLHSEYGHDGFLIENTAVSAQLRRLLP